MFTKHWSWQTYIEGKLTDFYKKLALECAGEQIAIDLFILAGQYCDLASMCM